MDRGELLVVLRARYAALAGHEHDGHAGALGDCARACDEAAHHCLDRSEGGGSHAGHYARAHEALMDCQAFCMLTAALMARSSPAVTYANRVCAEVCRNCAAACEGLGSAMDALEARKLEPEQVLASRGW